MHSLSMKKKIVISLLGLILFSAAGGLLAMFSVRSTISTLDQLVTLHQVENFQHDLIASVHAAQSDLYTVHTQFGNRIDSIIETVNKLEGAARRCTSCHHRAEVASQLASMQSHIERYKDALSYYITASSNRQNIDRLKQEAAGFGNRLLESTRSLALQASAKLEAASRATLEKVERIQAAMFLALGLTVILGIVISVHLTRSITRPIGALVDATRRIGAGSLGHTLPESRRDEFGELAASFNTMSTELALEHQKLNNEILERARTEDALRTSKAFLTTVFESIRDPFCIFDRDRRIVRANSAYTETHDGGNGPVLGNPCSSLSPDTVSPCGECLVDRTFQTASPSTGEISIAGADHPPRCYEVYTYPVVDAGGTVTHVIEYSRDITDRKQAELEAFRAQKLESVGILAGGIAHDFNNLLAAIMGNISLTLIDLPPGSKQHAWLTSAEKASLRAQDLTQQLLTFSRGGAPVKAVTSIDRLIRDSAEFAVRGSKVRCEILIEPGLWAVEADEGQLSQVINNLVINADQSMRDGGVIAITAGNVMIVPGESAVLGAGQYVRVTVKDGGTGIPPENLPKIFDPFFSTKERGTGLGLAISYSIVRKHGGHITVDSVVGKGTEFSLYIPATPRDVPPAEQEQPKPQGGSGTVLVMDDEDLIRYMACEMLRSLGYAADCVPDGQEAVDRFREALRSERPYDAVILDLTVPGGMGGQEALQRLRELDPNVIAIVSSGYSNDPVMSRFGDYGFKGCIAKPYRIADLSGALASVLQARTLSRPPDP